MRIFAHEAGAGGPNQPDVVRRELMRRTRVLGGDSPVVRGTRGRAGLGAFVRCLRPDIAHACGGWGALVHTLAALRGEAPFDVVHCHYGVIGLRYGVAARLWGAPLVVSFYGYDASRYPRERGERVYAPLFAAAQRVTSLSPHMDERLRALGCAPEKIRRVPLPVDGTAEDEAQTARLAALARDDTVRLLTVARLVEKKGIDVALRAIGAMRDELPAIRYNVIGDGPLRAELEALAASLGIADRVSFAGALSNDLVQQAMREADLFVLPSLTAPTGDEEGTPTVLLEASYARLPVLATRHAGIPEIVTDGESGVLVAEGDPGALAAGLRALLSDRERWPAMGEAGRRLVIERGHLTADVAARLEALCLEVQAEQEKRR